MDMNRDILLLKLKDYLEDRISKDDAYSWALGVYMKDDYAPLIQQDEMFSAALQALIDHNREGIKAAPTRTDLIYLKDCLEGAAEFEGLAAFQRQNEIKEKKDQKGKHRNSFLLILRFYVVLFAFCSITVNLYGLLNPLFLSIGNHQVDQNEVLIHTLPHLVYAVFLLLPFKTIVKNRLFYAVILLALTVGTIYYWLHTVSIAMRLTGKVLMAFVISPFSGIPATIALGLLLENRKAYQKQNSKSG